VDEASDNLDDKGLDNFTEPEKVFCEVFTKQANEIVTRKSGSAACDRLYALTARLMAAREGQPELCTTRVYFFCMAWVSGAVSTADKGRIGMTHCAIAFLAGAATVTAMRFIG
jgi:hypothetical protein